MSNLLHFDIMLKLQELRDISSMAMEHFDEKIVPTFKVNPSSPAAAAVAVVSSCGHNPVSPSKILSGSYMSIAGPSFLGVPGISSPVFGTSQSTPKRCSSFSVATQVGRLSNSDEADTSGVVTGSEFVEKSDLEKINMNQKILETTIKRQRRIIKKMQKVSSVSTSLADLPLWPFCKRDSRLLI